MADLLLLAAIAAALIFDFTNGFHDTANAIATSVSTRALSPRLAVLMAAVLNLVGALVTVVFFGARVMTPIVFWASLVPWPIASKPPDAICPSRKPRVTAPGRCRPRIR